jgi:hypothetical protein
MSFCFSGFINDDTIAFIRVNHRHIDIMSRSFCINCQRLIFFYDKDNLNFPAYQYMTNVAVNLRVCREQFSLDTCAY